MTYHAFRQRGAYGNRIPGGIDPKAHGHFDPTYINNLWFWVAASKLTGYSDGDSVRDWDGIVNVGNRFIQSTSGRRPLYKTNRVNSLPALYFDNTDDGMDSTIVIPEVPYSIFLVYNCQEASNYHRALQGSNNWLIGPYNGNHSLYNGDFITGAAVVAMEFVYATVIANSSGHTFRINGSTEGTNIRTTAPGAISLGNEGFYSEELYGDIAELIIYYNDLSSMEYGFVESYLSSKYNIT